MNYLPVISELLGIPEHEISERNIVLMCRNLMDYEGRIVALFQEQEHERMRRIMSVLRSVAETVPEGFTKNARLVLHQETATKDRDTPYLKVYTPKTAIKHILTYDDFDGYGFNGEVIAGVFLYMLNKSSK